MQPGVKAKSWEARMEKTKAEKAVKKLEQELKEEKQAEKTRRREITLERKRAAEERRRLEEDKAKACIHLSILDNIFRINFISLLSDGGTQGCTTTT
jgi:molecular chaperone GrpE (heat shock protein)